MDLSSLARIGLDRIRIMSESQLLEVLRDLVGGSQADRVDEDEKKLGDASGDPQTDSRMEAIYKAKWEKFRSKQETSLGQIQTRMEKLASAFVRMEALCSKLEKTPQRSRKKSAAPDHGALLREMLLGGQKPV